MGRLLNLNDLDLDPTWYFSDARYSTEGRRYVYTWPNPNFPYLVYIHYDTLKYMNDIRIKIRKWIETNISDTVIVDELDKNYRQFYTKDMNWDRSYEVTNIWWRFSFEDKHSALAFSLAFADIVQPLTDWHPKYPDDEKYLSKPVGQRYVE